MLTDPASDRSMKTAARAHREPRSDLLDALMELAGNRAELQHHSERAWASITFSGARHRVKLAFPGAEAVRAGERFIALLPEHEFAIDGQLVADAGVISVVHETFPQPCLTVEVELLLLEES